MLRFTPHPYRTVLFLFFLFMAYFLFWPVAVEPRAWEAPKAPEYAGDYGVNKHLADFEALSLSGQRGPEGVAVSEHYVYAATGAGLLQSLLGAIYRDSCGLIPRGGHWGWRWHQTVSCGWLTPTSEYCV